MKEYHFDLQYKICADFAFLFKLYEQGRMFYYIDRDVDLFDVTGLSSGHREQLYLEHCLICEKQPSLLKVLKYKVEDKLPQSLMRSLARLR